MIEFLYQTLAKIGYTHPIHPPLTHIPVGMVIGAFIFGLIAWLLRHEQLTLTARHCITLALLGLVPTAILGYMDWRHRYAGALSFPIQMKIGLAVLLLFFLALAAILGRRRVVSLSVLAIYGLCLLNVTALGYFGGELIFGSGIAAQTLETKEIKISAEPYNTSCGACHPGGGNSFKAHLPLKSAPQLADFKVFLEYLRNPQARDGSHTIMPPFPADKLTEQQVREIYRYIVEVLQSSSRANGQ